MMAHGTLLDAQLIALLDGHGGGELMRQQTHEGKGVDASALGLLLLFTTQAVIGGRGLHHTIEDVGKAPARSSSDTVKCRLLNIPSALPISL